MFQGFSDPTFDFLYGIHFNNERLWFAQHKEEYQTYLYRPLKALSEEVFDRLTARFPDKELQCRVTRIYRDARVYKGISCYKDSLWFTVLGPCPSPSLSPAMWFEICRDGWNYGMGLYRPSPAFMARHRQLVDADPRPLDRLYQGLVNQREFLLQVQVYRKLRLGPPPQLSAWYNAKSFSIIHEDRDINPLYDGPALVDRLAGGFTFLMPYFDYFYPISDAAHGAD